MENSNTRIIDSMYEAFGRGDLDALLSHVDDGVVFKTNNPPTVPWHGDYHGKDGVAQFFGAIGSSCEVLGFTTALFAAAEDRVISTGEFSCRANSTGKSGSTRFVFLWTLNNGKIVEYEQFHDNAMDTLFVS